MKNNLVIEKSFKYDSIPVGVDIPNDYVYCEESGYWINKNSNIPMMLDVDGPRPRTKKADVETGEDKKGE